MTAESKMPQGIKRGAIMRAAELDTEIKRLEQNLVIVETTQFSISALEETTGLFLAVSAFPHIPTNEARIRQFIKIGIKHDINEILAERREQLAGLNVEMDEPKSFPVIGPEVLAQEEQAA